MTMTLIQTVDVGSGGITGINFLSIPQTFTDLLVVASMRTAYSSTYQDVPIYFNNNGSGYSLRRMYGNGSSAASTSSGHPSGLSNSATSTSNTFSSFRLYIPNYTSANNKSFSLESVIENNSTSSFLDIHAGLWANTAAINEIGLSGAGQTIVQYATASLYGITKGSGGATVS